MLLWRLWRSSTRFSIWQCKWNGLVWGSSLWPRSLRRWQSFEDTRYLHPEDSAAAQREKDVCYGVALSWSEIKNKVNPLNWIWLQRRVKQPSTAETRLWHFETINFSVPKREETAFNLLLINLQISLLARKEHHALIKPSCFMGRATKKSVDSWYQKEMPYLHVA